MSYLSPIFLIGQIHIGSVEDASCINIGNNLPMGFEAYKKQNQGFGTINGDHNDLKDMENKLKDSHILDMLNQSEKEELPDYVKKLIKAKIEEGE